MTSVKTVLLMLVGALAGWVLAHNTVALECERLNGFYVGNSTYQCTKR